MRRSVLYGMLAVSCVLAIGAASVMVVLHFSDPDAAALRQVADPGEAKSSDSFGRWLPGLQQFFDMEEAEPEKADLSVPSGKWVRQCGERSRNCAAVWEIRDEKTGDRVLRVEASRIKDADSLRMMLFAPLGIHVNQPISINVDKGERVEAPILFCAIAGCIARFAAVPVFMAQQMIQGTKMQFVAQIPADSTDSSVVTITISLEGFTEVFQSL